MNKMQSDVVIAEEHQQTNVFTMEKQEQDSHELALVQMNKMQSDVVIVEKHRQTNVFTMEKQEQD
jgi:aerobic-type carbon monoxide dehydrogenase small subunit (CoxS/CutS family)